jgi:hypothetical protein
MYMSIISVLVREFSSKKKSQVLCASSSLANNNLPTFFPQEPAVDGQAKANVKKQCLAGSVPYRIFLFAMYLIHCIVILLARVAVATIVASLGRLPCLGESGTEPKSLTKAHTRTGHLFLPHIKLGNLSALNLPSCLGLTKYSWYQM